MSFIFTVETGAGVSDANAYATVEFADDYIVANTYASQEWMGLDVAQKQYLLVRSSQNIDVLTKWKGQRAFQDQGLKWPRHGAYDEDGFQIGDDCVPTIVMQAVCEFATYLMDDDWTAPIAQLGLRELQVDVIDIKYQLNYIRPALPDTVVFMLAELGYVTTGRRPAFKPIVRT
jgi:hypothetical protein